LFVLPSVLLHHTEADQTDNHNQGKYQSVHEDSIAQMPERTKVLLLAVRQALIIVLGALEDYMEMERSIVPRRKRTA